MKSTRPLLSLAGLIILPLLPGCASLDPEEVHRRALVLDGHIHLINRQFYMGGQMGDQLPDGQVDLPRLREGGVDAFFFSIYAADDYYPGRFETKHTFRLMELALEQLESHQDQIALARSAADVERIVSEGKMAAILDLEGTFDMDGDLLLLRALHNLGLRSAMIPAHNTSSNFADSCCDEVKWNGLNDHGRELIREMNRLGMIVNVAHGSTETILQAVEVSAAPILYSHGGFRHFVDIPRCISDEAAQAIASKGGVVGLQIGNTFNNPPYHEWRTALTGNEVFGRMPQERAEKLKSLSLSELDARAAARYPVKPVDIPPDLRMDTDHLAGVIDYAVSLLGEDHVAIGTDFDGWVPPPKEMTDASDYPEITKALVRLGYSEERIHKILGGNLLRLFREVGAAAAP